MSAFRRPIHAGFALAALASMSIAGCGHHAARVNTPLAPARIGSTETGIASWYGVPYDGRRAASGEIYDMRQLTAAHRRLPFQTWVEVTNLTNGKQVDVRINDRGPFVKGRIVDLSQAAARDIDMLRAGIARVRLKVIPPPPSFSQSGPSREPSREPVEITAAPAALTATRTTPPIDAAAPAPARAPVSDAGAPAVPAAAPPFAVAEPLVPSPPVTAPPITTTTTPIGEPSSAPSTNPEPSVSATAPNPERAVTTTSRLAPAARYAVQAGAFSDPARAEALRAILQGRFAEVRVAPSDERTPPLWRVIVGRNMTREQAAELAIRVRREAGAAVVVPDPEPARHN